MGGAARSGNDHAKARVGGALRNARWFIDEPFWLLNADIVADVQESGIAVPSTTRIGGVLAIRVALVNHRTRLDDVQMLLGAVLLAAQERLASSNFQAK